MSAILKKYKIMVLDSGILIKGYVNNAYTKSSFNISCTSKESFCFFVETQNDQRTENEAFCDLCLYKLFSYS